MKKKSTIIVVISMIILLTIIALASYSFFGVGSLNISNAVNLNTTTERNNMVFDTLGGSFNLHVDAGDMTEYLSGNIAAENNTTLTVNFQANTSYDAVCTYDIVYEWTSTNKYQAHTTGVTEKEFTIQAELTSNANVNEGMNLIKNEVDLADLVGNKTSAVVVSGAQIDSTGTSMNTAVWTLTTRFHNANGNQTALAGKTYSGRFKVANVSCVGGIRSQTFADYLTYIAPKSGTDAVSNSPWILTSDHAGEWRYAGKNPDNYVEFNGELWRIIGVMPNMTYCTGTYGTDTECNTTATGSLVKITRNEVFNRSTYRWDYKQTGVGSATYNIGSNDWSDSQLMLMLNGPNYLKTGYDVNGNRLHTSYTITNNLVAGNGYNYYNVSSNYLDDSTLRIYLPSQASTSGYSSTQTSADKKIEKSALERIATVKWDLYGMDISYQTSSTEVFYNAERNINGTGAVYNIGLLENRPVYWYGKIGLMYTSDYGYATNGGITYNRNTCLGYQIYYWGGGTYKTDCALNSWLLFSNITSSSPGASGTDQWTISPVSDNAFGLLYIYSGGGMNSGSASSTYAVRPTLYLKADTIIDGGSGKWNDPYTIGDAPKKYWLGTNATEYTYPSYAGTLYSDGLSTGRDVYMGQDNSKYYACANISGNELCLSQPYTQYGLSGHVLHEDFTSFEQASVKQAIYQIFIDAGIDITMDNCYSAVNIASCTFNNIALQITPSGYVNITNYVGTKYCQIDSDGRASCNN